MNITVAICTWNRAELLDQTLLQMQRLQIPDGLTWELLVVNNCCTDHTDEVIRKHQNSLPIKRLFEKQPGLSHARNSAVAAAEGELLIWTDDDVLVDEKWLEAYSLAAAEFSQHSFFGGPIEPWFEGTPPEWLNKILDQVSTAYAVIDYGDEEFDFSSRYLPFGANFAVRTELLKAASFDVSLGRVGTSMVSGEETSLLQCLLKNGHTGHYLPAARVRHFIPQSRQNLLYLRSYYAGHGVQLRRKSDGQVPHLLGKPRWIWKAWLKSEICYRWKRLTASPNVWIEHFKDVAMWRGAIKGKT